MLTNIVEFICRIVATVITSNNWDAWWPAQASL